MNSRQYPSFSCGIFPAVAQEYHLFVIKRLGVGAAVRESDVCALANHCDAQLAQSIGAVHVFLKHLGKGHTTVIVHVQAMVL